MNKSGTGKYTYPPKKAENLINEEEALKMLEICETKLDAFIISFLWLFGCRSTELLLMKFRDINNDDERLVVRIQTLKSRIDITQEDSDRKILVNRKPYNIFVETIIDIINTPDFVLEPDEFILPFNKRAYPNTHQNTRYKRLLRRINYITKKVTGKKLTPYHFRHSAVTRLFNSGESIQTVKSYKGAKSFSGLEAYLRNLPVTLEPNNWKDIKSLL